MTDILTDEQLAEIVNDLRENGAAIERLEENIAKSPDAEGLTLTMDSLLKRRQNLEGQFEQETNVEKGER